MNYGYDHPPEGDIDEIQELLKGYGSIESLVKEMIQNAEDASARRLLFQVTPENPQAPHPLLTGRGLCIINDGPLFPADLSAMKRLRLGTKGANVRAIGRFGKGLKSVYTFCEAFMVAASVKTTDGWPQTEISHFFNPRSGWRHGDWDECYGAGEKEIFRHIANTVQKSGFPGEHWVAFWLPLRHPEQDPEGAVGWIHEGELTALDVTLGPRLEDVLGGIAPSLVMLRNLVEARLSDAATSTNAVWRLEENSQRPVPIGGDPSSPIGGSLSFATPGQVRRITYMGVTGNLSAAQAEQIRGVADWPTVLELGTGKPKKQKGVPHFGAVLTTEAADHGQLRVRCAVFLPVSHQLHRSEVPLPRLKRNVTLTLHGFAFLDGTRTRIDWLEDAFAPTHQPSSKACLEWNRFVMGAGALAHLPEAIHALATKEGLSIEETAELISAFKQTGIWEIFSAAICSRQSLGRRWHPTGERWELIPKGMPVTSFPPIGDIAAVLSAFPGLSLLASARFLTQGSNYHSVSALAVETPYALSESDLVTVLTGVEVQALNTSAIAWLHRVLADHWQNSAGNIAPAVFELIRDLPLLAVRDGRTLTESFISLRDWTESAIPIFQDESPANGWLNALNEALPDFTCWIAVSTPPPWAQLATLDSLSLTTVPVLVGLTEKLAAPESRRSLIEELLLLRTPGVRQAIRYLLHGCADQIGSDEWLQVEEPGSPLWAELIQNVLAQQPLWTVLDKSWRGVFSGDTTTWLHLAPLNSSGAWDLLNHREIDWGQVAFDKPAWSDHKLSEVLLGLYEAGAAHAPELRQNLLRRLPLHRLQQEPGERVSIAMADGSLNRKFVLHSPGFERDLPEELQGEWVSFLNDCALVKRQPQATHAAVQLELFCIDGDAHERVPWELGWSYILRRCLESGEPGQRARLIDHGLKRGDQHHKGLGQLIRSTAWLPLSEGGHISPEKVVYFPGLGAYLRTLGDYTRDGWTSEVALADWLSSSLQSHLPRFLARSGRALELLSEWAEGKPQWALGFEVAALSNEDRATFLQQTEGMSNLPAAKLLAELCRVPNENAESWTETVWMELGRGLCRAFEPGDTGLERVRTILTSLATNRHRIAFDVYLRQTAKDGWDKALLPSLELVNKSGSWVSARRLIWPAQGVDPTVQLCDDQSKILKPSGAAKGVLEVTGKAWQDPGYQLPEIPDFDKHADTLIKYLEPFASGQVGPLVAAAFVVVLGPLPKLKAHGAWLLKQTHSPLGYDAFFADLMGDRPETIAWIVRQQKRFIFEFVDGESLQCMALTGEKFTASLSKRIDSLLVGSNDELARPRWVAYTEEGNCHLVRLRRFQDPESIENAVAVFAKTIDLILEWVQGRGAEIANDCPPDIHAYLESQDSGQTDLRRGQSYLFQSAESRLGELGARRMANLSNILRKFEESRIKQVEADDRRRRSSGVAVALENEARSLRKVANDALLEILKGQSQVARTAKSALVEALRHKMSDFQYSPESVLVELFQNADDAAVELAEMVGANDLEPSFSVRIDLSEKLIEVVHWGRPINYCRAGFAAGEQKGYRQDLPKMLTLNFSDKDAYDDQQPANTTGHFGLGFKSVFFLANEPEVLSDRIGFRIVAGFYPQGLTSEEMKRLRTNASIAAANKKFKPTIFHLNWQQDERTKHAASAFEHFRKQAHLFALFSRSIRQITLINPEGRSSIKPELISLGAVAK